MKRLFFSNWTVNFKFDQKKLNDRYKIYDGAHAVNIIDKYDGLESVHVIQMWYRAM